MEEERVRRKEQRRQGNAGPLGLGGFALTTFVLSCFNAGLFGVSNRAPASMVVGLALFYGGIAQGLAGMWEFRAGNTFAATAFTSYAAFWLSYAAILIPFFSIPDAYQPDHLSSFRPALATFLVAWAIFTFLLLVASFRESLAAIALFSFLTITFILLAVGEFKNSFDGLAKATVPFKRAGGWTGIITAAIAWYIALSGLFDNSRFALPIGKLGGYPYDSD